MLRSARERMIQTLAYELSGILLAAPLYGLLFGEPAAQSLGLVAAMSLAVLIWGPLYNTLFDMAELRLAGRIASDRSPAWRAVHALSLEASDMVVTLPLIMVMGGHGLLEGVAVDVGFTLFYAVYAYGFFTIYDRVRPVTVARSGSVSMAGPVAA